MRKRDWERKVATLKHSAGYLEDAVREFNKTIEMLVEDGYESDESRSIQKQAENSLASGLRFLEYFKKG